jgi:hypothetical protein
MALILTAGFIPVIATPVLAAGEDISAAFTDPVATQRIQGCRPFARRGESQS